MTQEGTDRRQILLVDDDRHLLLTLTDCLEHEGYAVTTAASGVDALQCLEESIPDLILLDVMMPGMDGGEVAQKIRGDFRYPDVPIIYLSAAFSKEDERRYNGVIAGEPFIAKPVDMDSLLARIRRALGEDVMEADTRS